MVAGDIKVSILFNLLLANITILLCFFFLFLVMLNNFFIITAVKENRKLKFVFAIPTGTPITLVKEIILISLIVADKTIKVFQNNQKQQCIHSILYLLFFCLEFMS